MTEIGTLPLAALPHNMDVDNGIDISHFTPHVNASQSHLDIPAAFKLKGISSREDWETLKPVIRLMYLDKNMTRQAVSKHIADEYNFRLTKRQFNRKFSEWDFEKNTKKAERISVLACIKRQNGIETTTIRGRKLDRAKVERWIKQDGAEVQRKEVNKRDDGTNSDCAAKTTHNSGAKASGTSGQIGQASIFLAAEKMVVDSTDSRTTADDCGGSLSIWETVNIAGSPRLAGLLGALSLYECEPFSLDSLNTTGPCDLQAEMDEMERCLDSKAQDDDNSCSSSGAVVRLDISSRKPKSLFMPFWTTQDRPSVGLSPFPTTAVNSNLLSFDFSLSDELPEYSEAECVAKLRRWSRMKPVDILDLVDSMWRIAHNYYQLRDFQSALLWYRRVIRLKKQKRARQLRPIETISACLNVIKYLRAQGSYAEARNLHRGVHEKILILFSNDEVALDSRDTEAWLLGDFGDLKEQEAIRREILQIQLSKFGPTSRQGLRAMHTLGHCLTQRKAFIQSEHLIRTALELQPQFLGHSLSEENDLVDIFNRQIDLARVLNRANRCQEAEQLLGHINKVFPDWNSIKDRRSFEYHFELAVTLRLQGRFGESEKIYQDLLGASLDPGHRVDVILQLAMISEQTSCGSEAAAWYKTTFDLCVEAYGLQHKYSLQGCVDLGSCYVRQGLFDEAVSHYEQTISKIELLHKEGDELPNENVEKIPGWIVELGTEMCKANGFRYAADKQFDEAILHFNQHIEKLVGAQMDLGLGPVYDLAAEGMKRIKRWISTVEMNQCKAVGFGFADKRLFSDAILHFQQHMEILMEARTDLVVENAGDSSVEGIERSQRWISIVKMDQCKAIGFDLANQGHFEEAIEHFRQIEAELAEVQSNGSEIDPDSNAQSIERVRRWIRYVLVDQNLASCRRAGLEYVDQGQFDEAILHYQQAITRVTEAQSAESDKNMYSGCVENLQAWISTAHSHKHLRSFWENGNRYANEGHFDQAVQYFRQTIDGLVVTQENSTHNPKECIEILKYWIEYTEDWKAHSSEQKVSEHASEKPGQDVEMEEQLPI